MEKKDTLSSCSDSKKQQMQLIQDNHKSKESCMIQTKEEKIYTSNSLDALDASSVIIESNGTESTEQDTTPDQRNDSQVDEAEIRPIIYEDQWPKGKTFASTQQKAPFLNVHMMFEHGSLSLGRQCQMASAENNTSGPVPQSLKDVCSQQFKPRSSMSNDVCSHQFRPRSSSNDF
ncbi:hypothetical protein Tco_0677630 [Tanacetum coccineum]|uniref:Uncharacterized protein n=1 Tax=Tanacetum coccineum TaxID=301880 RepID=A0ABQ4XCZ0_9ASTR